MSATIWSDDQSSPSAGPGSPPQPYGWLLPSAFSIPRWNFASRTAHLPFYFWLIDATRPRLIVDLASGRPDDYLAFCQAVEQLNYGAECLGVVDIFDERDSESDVSSPGAYHAAHFESISHLHDEPAKILEALGSRTIDLLHIDGQQTSQLSDIETQQWLARLSPRGLAIIVHPEHLAPSWRKVFRKRSSFSLNGKPNIELTAAAAAYPRQLSPAFKDAGSATAAAMRSAFEYFGSTLRERASHRDTASFASRVEISLAHQSAATDLLRADKTELEEKTQLQAQDEIRNQARIALLEQYVEQFRTEVLRLQEYAIKTQSEIERVQRIIGDRDLEIDRLQRAIADRDTEVRRLGNYAQKIRSENIRRINSLDEKIQEGEDEADRLNQLIVDGEREIARLNQQREDEHLHFSALAGQSEIEIARLNQLIVDRDSEIARLNQQREGDLSHFSALASQSEVEIARLNQLIIDSDGEIVRLKKFVVNNENEAAREVNQLVSDGEIKAVHLNGMISDLTEELRSANDRAILQRKEAWSREADLKARVVDLENTLGHITQSTAWKITRPFRLFFARLPRSARFLRRSLKFLWWTLSLQLNSRLKQMRHSRQRLPQPMMIAVDHALDEASTLSSFESASAFKSDGAEEKPDRPIIEHERTPNRHPDKASSESKGIAPVLECLPDVLTSSTGSLPEHADDTQVASASISNTVQIREAAPNRTAAEAALEAEATIPGLGGLPPAPPTLHAELLLQGVETPEPPPSAINIEQVLARIEDFEGRVRELASTVSLLGTPAPQSHIADRGPEVHQLGIGLERESARIQHVENCVLHLTSIVELERHRTDYALLGVDGMLKEIELYHKTRARTDYNSAFEQQAPLVSICVSTMNRSDILIERCLNSLVNQSYRNIQIIVVGDHCTDDTGSRIARLRDDRISFHNLSSRGPYPPPGHDRWMVAGTNAINAAMSMCEGQFVTHLDDDDAATIDRVETLLNAAQRHKADFCWHPFWYENKDGSWYRLGDGRFELGQITTGSTFYHRYFTKFPWDVFAYRTREPGDWNRLRKIRALRPNLHFVDRPLMFHYSEGSQRPFTPRNGELFVE